MSSVANNNGDVFHEVGIGSQRPVKVNAEEPPSSTTTSRVISNVSNIITLFIPPTATGLMQWGQTFLILMFLVIMFVSIILVYVYYNMADYQNRIDVISFAYLFGGNPQQQFQQYIKNTQTEIVASAMNTMQNATDQLNTTNSRLSDKADRLAKQMVVDVPNSNAQANNLGISIQKNIAQVRDTVSKLGGAFMLNNYMTDGAIKTVQSLNGPSSSPSSST